MPELPEVETTRRGIQPHILQHQISGVISRTSKLRWPISKKLNADLAGHKIISVERRAKYLLLGTQVGHLIIHLGMSGSLRIVANTSPAQKHDHFDLVFSNTSLRLRDPRRFGAVLWTRKNPLEHKLLAHLGPEPLGAEFDAAYLYQQARGRRIAVKEFIMNSQVVVGVGNIYATEALFMARINPLRAAGNISLQRYQVLCEAIKTVLAKAIECGGTTLRDFSNEAGNPGYFSIELQAYGRAGLPCLTCGRALSAIKLGQRTTTYCKYCQR